MHGAERINLAYLMNERRKGSPVRRLLFLLGRITLYIFAIITLLVIGGFIYYKATLYAAGERQAGYLALTEATVLVGEELELHSNATVLIRDGVIIQVGEVDAIDIPAEATVLNLAGYTVMPGLMDLHVHLGSPEVEAGEGMGLAQMPGMILDYMRFVPGKRRAFLAHGVTTIRSVGDEYQWIIDTRRQLRNGELEGPRLYVAGPLFTTPGGHPVVTIGVDPHGDGVRLPATPEEARHAVRELAGGDDPVDLIKVVQERGDPERRRLEPIAPDVLRAIVDEAHAHGLPVTAHWGTPADLEDMLAAGVDGLEHLEPRGTQEAWPPALLASLVARDVSLTPTLAVLAAATRRPNSPLPPSVIEQPQQQLAAFHAAGGRVVVGSDAGMPGVRFGPGVHRELELLVESGLTPQAALKAATSEAAKVLRVDHIGAIEPGRAADLVVVNGDPLARIQDAQNIVMVFRDGRRVVDRLNVASDSSSSP
jgi:enamidase